MEIQPIFFSLISLNSIYYILYKFYFLPKMSDYNVHLRNVNIQNIVLQNEELRRCLQAARQNQQITADLKIKLDLFKTHEAELLEVNASLLQKLKAQQVLMEEKDNAYTEEMQYVFAQHDKMLLARDQELRLSRIQVDRLTDTNRQLQGAVRIYQEKEREIGERYQVQFSRLKNRIEQFESEIQIAYRNSQNDRYAFEKARSAWAAQKQAQSIQMSHLINRIKKFESDNILLMDYSRQLQANLIKSEQQNRNNLVTLREKLINQEEEIQHFLRQNKELETSNQIVSHEIAELKRLQAHISSDNQTLLSERDKLANLLDQSKRECVFLKNQVTQLELALNKVSDKKDLQMHSLRSEQLQLLRSKTEVDAFINLKITELRQVSAAANNLQTLVNKQEQQIISLRDNLQQSQLALAKQKKRNSQQSIQAKELIDKNTILKLEIGRLEEINHKLQVQIESISGQTLQLAKHASNPREINKQFVEQMNRMLIKFRQQRDQQTRLHALEKDKLKQRYEFEIKQVELDLLKKISILQEQLAISKKYEILAERNSNIYTYTTLKFES